MKFEPTIPPRRFTVGTDNWVTIADCARVTLRQGEMVSVSDTAGRFAWPVVRRRWGFALPTPLGLGGALRYVISGKARATAHLLGHYQDGEAALAEYETREQHLRLAQFPRRALR